MARPLALFDAAGALSRQSTAEMALVLGQLGLYLQPEFPALQMLVADSMEAIGSERRQSDVCVGRPCVAAVVSGAP